MRSALHSKPGGSSAPLGFDRMRARRPLAAVCCAALAMISGQIIQNVCLVAAQNRQQQDGPAGQPSAATMTAADRQSAAAAAAAQVGGFDFGTSGGGASLSAGLADSMMNLGQTSGYLNSKRARKMSAFMPMRGRKDGRDGYAWQQPQPTTTDDAGYAPAAMQHEEFVDIAPDERILRLALAANQAAAAPNSARSSFVEQVLARRAAAQQQQSRQQPSGGAGEVAFEPGTSNLVLEAASAQPAVMQAKLRRAFHPMRGKKLDSGYLVPALDLLEMERAAAELDAQM